MLNKFLAIKLWRKQINLFDRLNRNVLFHEVIKKKATDCTIIPQKQLTRSNRKEYFKPLFERYVGENQPIDFLEFGVYRGESLFGVSNLNKNPHSRFFGFDTFEGYPESFDVHSKGDYSTNGVLPETDDKRIKLVKGLFQDTLNDFLKSFVPKSRLVIHMDADLYSATLFVLTKLDRLFDKNTIISFDEFGSLDREFLAFYDYVNSHYHDFEMIQHTPKYKSFNKAEIII